MLAEHPRGKHVYNTMPRLNYWPQVAHYVSSYVVYGPDCRRHQRYPTHQRLLLLLPLHGCVEFVATDTWGTLTNTEFGNCFVDFITDGFFKFIRANRTKERTATQIPEIFLDAWMMLYKIPDCLSSMPTSLCRRIRQSHGNHVQDKPIDDTRLPATCERLDITL